MASGCCCLTCIPQAYAGVLESVGGQFKDILPPGLHCLNPCTVKLAGVVSFKTEMISCDMQAVSSDRTTVLVRTSILYRVIPSECHRAYYSTSSTTEQIQSYVVSSLRSILPTRTLDELFSERQEIVGRIQSHLQVTLRALGFEIVDVLLTDIEIQGNVRAAMNQQATQRYARVAAQYEAEAKRIVAIKVAEAEAEASRLRGVGTAAARSAIANAFREGMGADSGRGANESQIMAMVLMAQYFDMMNDIANNRSVKPVSYFVPTNDIRGGVDKEKLRERVSAIVRESRLQKESLSS